MLEKSPNKIKNVLGHKDSFILVKSEIDTILGNNIIFTPSQFVLDLAPDGRHNRERKLLLHPLLMTACKMVTIRWMNPQPPTAARWRCI